MPSHSAAVTCRVTAAITVLRSTVWKKDVS